MKVIFTQDVPDVAKSGQLKDVADGYARNFLIPKKYAVVATEGTLNAMAAKMEARKRSEAQEEAENKEIAEKINNKEIAIEAKSGGGEKLYGSITNADIAAALEEATGYAVDKRKIKVKGNINAVGTYNIEIRLGKDIAPTIRLAVKGSATAEAKEDVVAEVNEEPVAEVAEEIVEEVTEEAAEEVAEESKEE